MHHPYNPDWSRTPKCGKYLAIKCPEHPRAWKNGYLYLHRVVMEVKLGRILSPDEVVHHKDENGHNDSPDNLELMESQAAHGKLHGDKKPSHGPVPCICAECGVGFFREFNQRIESKGYNNTFCSYRCNGIYQQRSRHALVAQQIEQPGPNGEVVGAIPI